MDWSGCRVGGRWGAEGEPGGGEAGRGWPLTLGRLWVNVSFPLRSETIEVVMQRALMDRELGAKPTRGGISSRESLPRRFDVVRCEPEARGPRSRVSHEEDLSTQQQTAEEEPRISRADADQGRTQGSEHSASQGTQADRGLRLTLSRASRLRKRAEFRRVYDKGVRSRGRHMVVFALPNPEGVCSRLGVTASRKVGCAVVRSRCRRRLRELFRVYFRSEKAQSLGTLDIVMNARFSCSDAPWDELRQDVELALVRFRAKLPSAAARDSER